MSYMNDGHMDHSASLSSPKIYFEIEAFAALTFLWDNLENIKKLLLINSMILEKSVSLQYNWQLYMYLYKNQEHFYSKYCKM